MNLPKLIATQPNGEATTVIHPGRPRVLAILGVLLGLTLQANLTANENATLLYSTDFTGPDQSLPEGWSLRGQDPEAAWIMDNKLVFDRITQPGVGLVPFAFYEGADGQDPSTWTDYVVEVTVSYDVELAEGVEGIETRGARFVPLLAVRAGDEPETGLPSIYTLQFLADDFWGSMPTEEELAEGPRTGGGLRLFKFGPNTNLVDVANIIESADGFIPKSLTVKMRLAVQGSTLTGQLFDEAGTLLATLRVEDEALTSGTAGFRAVISETVAIRYDDFRVYEYFDVAPATPAKAENVRLGPNPDFIELSYPTELGRFYAVQKRVEDEIGEESWTRIETLEGTGAPETHLLPMEGAVAEDFRVVRTTAAMADLPVLYSTNFEGEDLETPEGWTLVAGDPFYGTRFKNHYDFDYRFDANLMTFLAVLDEGAEWTDYIIETTVTTQRAEPAVAIRNILPGLVARVLPGATTNTYHARMLPRSGWPADWQETGARGGMLEIFRLGGAGNRSMSTFVGVLDPDPNPAFPVDPVTEEADATNPMPEPGLVTSTYHFSVIDDHIFYSMWDEGGSFLGQTSTQDNSILVGAPGIRIPALRDGIISYDTYKVYDLSGVTFDEEHPELDRTIVPHLEVVYDGPVGLNNYQVQQSTNLSDWEDLGGESAVRGGVRGEASAISNLFRADAQRGFVRVKTIVEEEPAAE